MTNVPPAHELPPAQDGHESWLKPLLRFLAREWPYLVILVLSLFGVAYTSITRTPMTLYWFVLAPFIGLVCVVTRWPATQPVPVMTDSLAVCSCLALSSSQDRNVPGSSRTFRSLFTTIHLFPANCC